MLQLKNIVKTYVTGDLKQDALRGVSISFRENEFVSILGPSGSGKTTLLNIIGGLDRYTGGDLVINGVSTTAYKDADWDYYRNNSVGFVFQSYHLIPHQSVLANVEMALTLAGVSQKERRQRAAEVLKKVGLGDQMHKRPNQMSGGQMQRVAIARALVNNPDILLADEPTGALDSETGIRIMELLKEIAKDRLVIMVTHNPDLAERYSTRIVKLLDGRIVDDTDPCCESTEQAQKQTRRKISMSFGTALALSFDNLRTKKGRTLLTAFAGSIGIIGIALILALSTGMNAYIADVQKETMASYPITVSEETIGVSGMMGLRSELVGEMRGDGGAGQEQRTGVYADYRSMETGEKISSSIVENDLTEFKKYLDNPDSEIHPYLGENGIVYTYDVQFCVYTRDADGVLVDSDGEADGSALSAAAAAGPAAALNRLSDPAGGASTGAANFSQLMAGADGKTVSPLITDSYDVLYGGWPEKYNEVALVLNERSGIPAGTLYQLGFLTKEQYEAAAEKIENGEAADEIRLSHEDVCGHTFYLVAACDHYLENEDGTFTRMENIALHEEELLAHAVELHITGVIRPKEDAQNAVVSTAVAYTAGLTEYVITHTDESAVVRAQEADSNVNVLTGRHFASPDDAAKAREAKAWLSALGISEKASFYQLMLVYAQANPQADGSGAGGAEMAAGGMGSAGMDETAMAAALDRWLAGEPDQEALLKIYEEYLAGATFEENLKAFGKVSFDAPASIGIYTDSFENKDAIAACVEHYNETAAEAARITYTDYVAMLTSSVTAIINGISYVLIAFVAVSLIVSCIMIGIITHISVMERTKEIGILRALGASRRNISQVFNAETFLIGCCAGLLGVGISLLALVPMNDVIARVSGLAGLKAQLPLASALLLIALSILITVLGGLLPARRAAKKDPVIALRSE